DAQRAQFLDRTFEGAGQRAAEIGRPDPDRPIIGLDLQGDDWACAVRIFRGAGKRLVGRKGNDRRANTGDLHRISLNGGKAKSCTPRAAREARSVSPLLMDKI